MKKFKFSLKKLLSYKAQIFESEKLKMSLLIADLNNLENNLKSTVLKKDQLCEFLNHIISKGTNSFEISKINFSLESYRKTIKLINDKIARVSREIELQRHILLNISKEVSSLEKLKEKKKFEYNKKLLDHENKKIEEYLILKRHFESF